MNQQEGSKNQTAKKKKQKKNRSLLYIYNIYIHESLCFI